MAKTNEQFDQHFKEKLDGHREKPSAIAWQRLESQLPKESKPAFGIWWAIAASVTALLVTGYAFWPGEKGLAEENPVAEKNEMPIEAPLENSNESTMEDFQRPIENNVETTEIEFTPENKIPQGLPKEIPKTPQKTTPTISPALTQAPKNLLTQIDPEPLAKPISVTAPELNTHEMQATLPELKAQEIEKTLAQTTSTEAEPAYRVSIYSNGVKKGDPQDKNLITELGKTVGQVESLLSKVDDGLISLQDKKDNLFASLTSKKNQADEKP